jgi:hypothetical protein
MSLKNIFISDIISYSWIIVVLRIINGKDRHEVNKVKKCIFSPGDMIK